MAKKLWGGRFNKKTDPLVEEFTKSIDYDYKLARYDVIGSTAHVSVLEKADLLTREEAVKLRDALGVIYEKIKDGTFKFNKHDEDIHTNIQNAIQSQVGDLALKLHTARSRNDQVVLATKLYLHFEVLNLFVVVIELMMAILELVKKNAHIIIPGFTHLQHAQPVLLTDYLSAYVEMLGRDKARLKNIYDNMKITMGAGALAGTPIDSEEYSVKLSAYLKEKGLGEKWNIEATTNSLDTVSDRDFVIEIDEAFCTGSSLMPHKKNPDVLELIRGYAGKLYGNLISVLTMMKGLPLTYNRDMQLDKEPLFNSIEIVSKELKVLTGLVSTLKFNEKNIKEHLKDESLYATDLVYYLVEKDVAFKNAHTIVGRLIKYSIDNDIKIKNMTKDQLKKFSKKLVQSEIIELFNPEKSVFSKKSVKKESPEEKLAKLSSIEGQSRGIKKEDK